MSQNLYSFHKTILNPSTMDMCAEASFVHPNQVNLIIVKANILQIFKIVQGDDHSDSSGKLTDIRARLIHIIDYSLHGRISSIGVVRTQSNNGLAGMDSLLLSFADAKMSLLEWSLETNSIQNVSIHYYEREEFKKISSIKSYTPQLRVDHQSRCAILHFYTDRFAILPFKLEASLDTNDFNPSSSIDDVSTKKQPYLPSIVIPISAMDPSLKHIQDFCFLYDYFEPTLAILYETNETWTGRLAVRQDTKSLLVVSVDAATKSFPTLFRIDHIPYNAFKVIPVPGPTGGVLIITPNGIIHVDQTSAPGISLSVNKYFGKEKEIKIKHDQETSTFSYYNPKVMVSDYSHLDLFLGDSQLSFLNPDTALIILTDGRMFVLRLECLDAQNGFSRLKNGVTSFCLDELEGLFASRPSAICRLGVGFIPEGQQQRPRILGSLASKGTSNNSSFIQMGYIFVGSSVDNGQLIQFVENSIQKQSKTDFVAFGANADASIDEDDDLEDIYGTKVKTEPIVSTIEYRKNEAISDLPQFQFRVCDQIKSHGVIQDMAIGRPAKYSAYPFQSTHPRVDLELVTCGGTDPQGHLAILQRNFRPRILSSFEMPKVVDVWAIRVNNQAEFNNVNPYHHDGYLFLSKHSETLVLKTGEEIQELEKQYFYREDRTIGVETVLQREFILQVCRKQVFLYDSYATLLSSLDVGVDDDRVSRCSISENYCLLQFDSGRISLLNINKSGVIAVSELKDWDISCCTIHNMMDIENKHLSMTHFWMVDDRSHLKICNEKLDLIYSFENLADFPELLCPSEDTIMDSQTSVNAQLNAKINIVDMVMVDVPSSFEFYDTYLIFKTVEDQVIIYKQFDDASKMKFSRIPHELLTFDPSRINPGDDIEDQSVHDMIPIASEDVIFYGRSLRPFSSIGSHGYSGVFVCGKRPCVVILRKETDILDALNSQTQQDTPLLLPYIDIVSRNQTAVHPFFLDGNITTFTEFKNPHCENGFIYFNQKGSMRIATLTDHFHYDTEWPMAKIKFPYNPQHITYHAKTETYVVASAIEVKYHLEKAKHAASLASGIVDSSELQEKPVIPEREKGLYVPKIHEYKLSLVSPITWEIVDEVELNEYEHVICMVSVQMNASQTESGKKELVAIGTGYVRGEDLACRGRTLLYDVIEVVPEPDNPQTNHKLKNVCSNDEKGQVSALANTSGVLVCGIGSKVIVQALDEDESLCGNAFIDVNFFVTSISAVKNLIIIGDIVKGVTFLGFQEEPPKLILLGKDYYDMNISAVEYLIDDKSLGFLAADEDKNLHVIQYQPYHFQSSSGQRLLRKGDFHADKSVGKWIRLRRLLDERRPQYKKSHLSIGSSYEGSLLVVSPIPENIYKRLYALYSRMVYKIQHLAGLNPRGYRQVKLNKKITSSAFVGTGSELGPPGPRMMLDGDLLFQLFNQRTSLQDEIAQSIGSDQRTIRQDLYEVFQGSEYF